VPTSLSITAVTSSTLLPTAPRVHAAARRRPLALIALGVTLYSIGPVFVAASSAPGPVFSFWRLWLGVPVLGVATLLQLRNGGRRPDRRALRYALGAGIAFGLHQVLFMTAIKLTSVVDVSLMNTMAPIMIAVAAVPLFGERPGAGFRLWTLVAMAGAAVVIVGASAGPQGSPAGTAMAAANVVAFGAFFLLSKLGRDHIDVLPFLFGTMVVAATCVSAFAVVTAQPVGAVSGTDLAYALAVAAGPGALGHFVMTWPLRWVPANIPPVMRLAQPAIAGFLAWLFLAQPITGAHALGGALTVAGVCGAILTPTGRRFAGGDAPAAGAGEPEPVPHP
jgi:drug/metabolite transporter (DMT)-like permease